jgi:hypothetical protein
MARCNHGRERSEGGGYKPAHLYVQRWPATIPAWSNQLIRVTVTDFFPISYRRFGLFVVEGFFGGMVGLTSASARLRRDKWCFVTE